MSDPLTLLQSSISSNSATLLTSSDETTEALSASSSISLSGTTFPKSTPTRYLKPNSSWTSSTQSEPTSSECYTLEALYLAWLHRDAPSADYLRFAREAGIGPGVFVSVMERSKVVDFLGGGLSNRLLPEDLSAAQAEVGTTTPSGTPPSKLTDLPETPSKDGLGASTTPFTPGGTAKRRYVPNASDMDAVKKIKANEVELKSRATVLRGNKLNNFTQLRQTYSSNLKKLRETSSTSSSKAPPATSVSKTTPASSNRPGTKRGRPTPPIIIISSSPTSLVTMWNVKKFLSESEFVPPTQARTQSIAEGSPRPPTLIPIDRRVTSVDSGNREVAHNFRYLVVDGVESLQRLGGGQSDPWERVICVMTTGQAWQFRPYKWSEPRELFHHVKGIHVCWSSDPPNIKIKDWNVEELKIDPHRRHLDKSTVAHFWKVLDDWVGLNKPGIMKGL